MSNHSPPKAFLAVYIITFLIGFPNTLLALYSCIHKIRRKPFPIDIFMLNLVVSDLIFITFLPMKMKEAADDMVWNMSTTLCKFSLFSFFLPLYSSGLFLAAISTERYVCVAFPVKYKSPKRIIYTILICVGIWIYVAVSAVFPYKAIFIDDNEVENSTTSQPQTQICYSNFTKDQLNKLLPMRLSSAVSFVFIPLLICCFSYFNFIRILLKCPLMKRQRKLRMIGLVVGTLLVFACSFLSYNASHIVGFIKKEDPSWRMHALMLCTLNVCYDLLIFFCISREMRRAIKVCAKALLQFYNYLMSLCANCCSRRERIQ